MEDYFDDHLPELEWHVTFNMGIDELRLFYDHICYSIKVWPGSPARPAEEQEYLQILKKRLFAMILEYQFTEE
jgi:hypothetical protein|tara:strand:+ start:63 stop:281 length:219 start_codon:yes stop_codon:yes gene_type:complete